MYNVTVKDSNRELTARERIMLKDTSNAEGLDAITQEAMINNTKVIIEVDTWALLQIENDRADDAVYENIVIVDRDGVKYVTGSKSFITTFLDIAQEMKDCGEEDLVIQAFRKESKNYKGKFFITCSLV